MRKEKKSFAQRKGGQRRATLAELKRLFQDLSGGDDVQLFEEFIQSRFAKKLAQAAKTGNRRVISSSTPTYNGAPHLLTANTSLALVPSMVGLTTSATGAPQYTEMKNLETDPLVADQIENIEQMGHIHDSMEHLDNKNFMDTIDGIEGIETGDPNELTQSTNSLMQSLEPVMISNSSGKLEKVSKAILSLYNEATNYKKRQWASLLAPYLTYNEMRSVGFCITTEAFARARKHAKEIGAGRPAPPYAVPDSHPKHKLSDDEKQTIIEFCESEEISRLVPDETVVVKEKRDGKTTSARLPKRVLNVPSISRAYFLYKQKYGDIYPSHVAVGETLFRKTVPRNIVKQ